MRFNNIQPGFTSRFTVRPTDDSQNTTLYLCLKKYDPKCELNNKGTGIIANVDDSNDQNLIDELQEIGHCIFTMG